jgi:hypothetical protein
VAVVEHHFLLGLALAALGGSSLRIASLAAPAGSLRVLAAAPIAAATAVLEALLLGLVGLGTNPIALTAAAGLTWVVARALLPAPAVSPWWELGEWWRRAGAGRAAGAGAALALAVAVAVWLADEPFVGPDGLAYHLPDVLAWVHDGRPGSLNAVLAVFPVEHYPLTNEVLLAWAMGISRGFAVLAPFQLAFAALLGGSVLAGLRRLGVPAAVRLAAVTALLACPLVLAQLNGVSTDLAALAWLACAGALCTGAPERPALLGPALVAAGLAVGTKTTAFAPAAVALLLAGAAAAVRVGGRRPLAVAAGALGRRSSLGVALVRAGLPALPWRALGLAAVAAAAVGGVWYVRNLVLRGSPFWPLVAAPWGDPVPPFLAQFDQRFAADPVGVWKAREAAYTTFMAGGLVLLGGALLAPLLSRRRAILAASGTALALVLLWTLSPYTGLADRPDLQALGQSTYRYLLPAILVATLALALAARRRRGATAAAVLAFAGSTAWSVVEDVRAGTPYVPSPWLVLGALAGGALLGAGAWRVAGSRSLPTLPRAAGALAAIAGTLLLAVAVDNWTRRHALTGFEDSELVRWMVEQPGFQDGGAPVAQTPIVNGALAGDGLRHAVPLVPGRESCARTRDRAREGWVVIRSTPVPEWEAVAHRAERCLRATLQPRYDIPPYRVYRVYRAAR